MTREHDPNLKYLVWNNKGGVGKTFLTYMLSVEFALNNPDVEVIIIDACPQANVSEMLLGGNGKGENNLEKFRSNNLTIAGYIKERYERSRSSKLGNEIKYFVNVRAYNNEMPSNIYLLPGDVDLDICSSIINYLGTAPERNAWKKSRSFLSDLISSFEDRAQESPRRQIYFIDCNPSFANYTEMAVIASNRIIVPCTADAASIRGIRNLFKLIYGIDPVGSASSDDVFLTFNRNSIDSGTVLPKVHRFVLNKSRTNLKDAASAFKSHVKEIENVVNNVRVANQDVFSDTAPNIVLNLKDGNTLAAIINHVGYPLSRLPPKRYSIYGRSTQANASQIKSLLDDLRLVLAAV